MSVESIKPEPKPAARKSAPNPVKSEADLRAEIEAEMNAKWEARFAMLEERLTAAPVEAPKPVRTAVDPTVLRQDQMDDENSVLIHFVDDGFTIGNKVCYRGEEMRVPNDSPFLADTNRDQIRRYNRLMWKLGPWDGAGFDLSDPTLTDTDRAKLLRIMDERGL